MAKVVDTYTTEDGHEIAVYESGAEYDWTDKKLVKPAAYPRSYRRRAGLVIFQPRSSRIIDLLPCFSL